jgi:nucleoside diphosphate kinase
MYNELKKLTSPSRQKARRKAAAAKNAKLNRARANRIKAQHAGPSNGFKAVVNRLTSRQLIDMSLHARNMTAKERDYVNATMVRRSRFM